MHSKKIVVSFPLLLFAILFLVVGLGFTIAGVFVYGVDSHIRQTYIQADATVVDIRHNRNDKDIIVEYDTADGVRICTELSEYSSSVHVGSIIQIAYDPANPYDVQFLAVYRILWFVFFCVGLTMVPIGAVSLFVWYKRHKKARWLRENGRRVLARVESYRIDNLLRLNNRSSVFLICKAQIYGKEYTFRYRQFIRQPHMLIGKYVVVFYDPNKPTQYVVEGLDNP